MNAAPQRGKCLLHSSIKSYPGVMACHALPCRPSARVSSWGTPFQPSTRIGALQQLIRPQRSMLSHTYGCSAFWSVSPSLSSWHHSLGVPGGLVSVGPCEPCRSIPRAEAPNPRLLHGRYRHARGPIRCDSVLGVKSPKPWMPLMAGILQDRICVCEAKQSYPCCTVMWRCLGNAAS